jgi:hypothetical protein
MCADVPRAAVIALLAACLAAACAGGDASAPMPESRSAAETPAALQGTRVSGRDEALRFVDRGLVAPIQFSELAHETLLRWFEWRSIAGSTDPLAAVEGLAEVDIVAADNAEGLLLRGEAGFVRAVLRFEHAAFGAARVDGEVTLESSRSTNGAGAAHRCQADSLAVTDRSGTRHWSYLDIAVDSQHRVQRLSVVSDLTEDAARPVWIDVVSNTPGRLDAALASQGPASGRFVATGVAGFLNSRLVLQVGADRSWTIEVDNDKDDEVDFAVHASADEVRTLMSVR